MTALLALWNFVKPFRRELIYAAAVLAAGWWLHHHWYQAGYKAAEDAYQAAVLQASTKFAAELKARDEALAEAQGHVTEVVKWRTRTETVYQEAAKNDADCKAWFDTPIACPLGVQPVSGPAAAGNSDAVPSHPAQPGG